MALPGIGDPYWYEWFVGLDNIIEMLNPDKKVEYVILQAEKYDTIDDVVVGYENGKVEHCYQVKHEIGDVNIANLTFNKLIKKEGAKPSLIEAIANGWYNTNQNIKKVPILYTNRDSGVNKTNREFNGKKYKAIPLEKFYICLKEKIKNVKTMEEIVFEEDDLNLQWEEFIATFTINQKDIFNFLKVFEIKHSMPSLNEKELIMINKLKKYFNTNEQIANKLFNLLVANLRKWTTVGRENEKIFLEDVYEALSINGDISVGEHDLYPPYPFFPSREKFIDELIENIKKVNKKVIFLTGNPGSGKTTIASYLNKVKNLFTARFYAFKPISPDQTIYDNDSGLFDSRALWGDLLIQLKKEFKGELEKYNIPIINELCSTIQLKKEVLRLSKELYIKNNKKIYICIDGIDHAARSNNENTFLEDLPFPSEIPEGVCFFIIGQPSNMYSKYPEWLSYDDLIEHFEMPTLKKEDIRKLFNNKNEISWIKGEDISLKPIIEATMLKTAGNNLSVIFAIEDAKICSSAEEYYLKLDKKYCNGDINRYYSNLWKYASKMIIDKGLNIKFIDAVISSSIILMNGQINTEIIANSLKKIGTTVSDWDYIMELLYPLVIPVGRHKFAVYHNDFRVYLTGIASKYGAKFREVAQEWLTI